MPSWFKIARVVFEVIGGAAICMCLVWFAFYRMASQMGQPCVNTQVKNVHSPGGTETAQQRFRTCGGHSSVEVLLNVPGDEGNFMRMASFGVSLSRVVRFNSSSIESPCGRKAAREPFRLDGRLPGSYSVVNKIAAYGIAQNWHKI